MSSVSPVSLPAWGQLAKQALALAPIADLLNDSGRNQRLHLSAAGITADFSKQRVAGSTLDTLLLLARQVDLEAHRRSLLEGGIVNVTENRPALHTALRTPAGKGLPGIETEVQRTRARVADFVSRIRDGSLRGCTRKPFRHVVYIGIGGSHLGPELAVRALGTDRRLDIRFVSNIDGYALSQALDGCDPERTLFVTASKSFSTLETLENSRTARSWFLERTGLADGVANHFAAISANVEAAAAFGIHPDNVFPMWDWVGGRYSLWSAVGMPVALALGNSAFDALLAGARAMDEHFADAPLEHNMPVLAALFGVWNTNFLGAENHAVLAYDERLTLLPLYLQQLETESNGKRTRVDGTAVDTHTMPILWGGVGTSGQHAYHQLLHQGTRAFSADFIFTAESATPLLHHHRWLQANALAQSQAMFLGDATTQPEKQVPGNHATTTLVLDRLDAYHLGALLALHEHQVFCQGVIWGINSFDQWGVELGKRLANPIHEALEGGESRMQDASTRFLINHLRAFDQSSASSGSQP